MGRTARNTCESGIYHLTGRGSGRQIIYEDDVDRKAFLRLLSRKLLEQDVEMLAWCLMDNHFHLLAKGEMPAISHGMRSLLSAYALNFNARHDRCGHLFQDRFASQCVTDDLQLLTAIRYIHFNPIKGGLSEELDYPWSSYGQYAENRRKGICKTAYAQEIVGSKKAFLQMHASHLQETHWLDDKPFRRRLVDSEARHFLEERFGGSWARELATLDRAARDERLAIAKAHGLSIRQLQRLTGLGFRIIAKAGRQTGHESSVPL